MIFIRLFMMIRLYLSSSYDLWQFTLLSMPYFKRNSLPILHKFSHDFRNLVLAHIQPLMTHSLSRPAKGIMSTVKERSSVDTCLSDRPAGSVIGTIRKSPVWSNKRRRSCKPIASRTPESPAKDTKNADFEIFVCTNLKGSPPCYFWPEENWDALTFSRVSKNF